MNKARDIREQIEGLCERVELEATSSPGETDLITKCFCSGYFYHIARLTKIGEYKTAKQQHTVYIHPSSVLSKLEEPPAWIVYHELAFTTKEYMRMCSPIKPEWIIEVAPHYYEKADIASSELATKKMPRKLGKAADEGQGAAGGQ